MDPQRLLCRLAELAHGGCREFRLGAGDRPLRGFVVRTGQGTNLAVHAYINLCRHMPFRMNYLPDDLLTYDGRFIECKMHGARYEKDTGLCVHGPCLGRSLISLPVHVQEGCVLLADGPDIAELAMRYAAYA